VYAIHYEKRFKGLSLDWSHIYIVEIVPEVDHRQLSQDDLI